MIQLIFSVHLNITNISVMRFDVFTAINTEIKTFWCVTPCTI